jgi:ribose-phosphate pyrophosphokinase
MKPILFLLGENSELVNSISKKCGYEIGEMILHQFPDEETGIQILSDVKDREIILITGLEHPNNKLVSLLFTARTAYDLGAKKIGLVMPYLPYMRQDAQFKKGEGITSQYFAAILSNHFDWLVTMDPHLHRYRSLNEIYMIPTFALHATIPISQWIKKHVYKPLLIGPDKESEQWVTDIANHTHAPFVILQKNRIGDTAVTVSIAQIEKYSDHTPVLIDDIISTAKTMIETIKQLKSKNAQPVICLAVHAIFSGTAYSDLLAAGASQVVTCNTVAHTSNKIDVTEGFLDFLRNKFGYGI